MGGEPVPRNDVARDFSPWIYLRAAREVFLERVRPSLPTDPLSLEVLPESLRPYLRLLKNRLTVDSDELRQEWKNPKASLNDREKPHLGSPMLSLSLDPPTIALIFWNVLVSFLVGISSAHIYERYLKRPKDEVTKQDLQKLEKAIESAVQGVHNNDFLVAQKNAADSVAKTLILDGLPEEQAEEMATRLVSKFAEILRST